MKICSLLHFFRPLHHSKSPLVHVFHRSNCYLPNVSRRFCHQTKLIPKSPGDSFEQKILKFSQDESLRSKYMNPLGELRFGMIMEELDSMAGVVAYRHSLEGSKEIENLIVKPPSERPIEKFSLPLTIVTASCDRIELFHKLEPDRDIVISGRPVWVGRSSMDILLQVDSLKGGTRRNEITGHFIMVARDHNNKAIPVRPLKTSNMEEELLFQEATKAAQRRKLEQKISLDISPPSDEERQIIHELFILSKKYKHNRQGFQDENIQYCYPSDTRYQSTLIMQPQERNIHNKIFGGYLMKKAFEIAWSVTYIFTKEPPMFRAVADIDFFHPVEIGDIVTFTGEVVCTHGNVVEVSVAADVINPKTNSITTTNVFHMTFLSPNLKKRVIPYTYEDAMKYIEGRRQMDKVSSNILKSDKEL